MNSKTTTLEREPWDYCDRCGIAYSEIKLSLQYGIKVCPWCFDDTVNDEATEDKAPPSDEKVIL